MNTPVKKNYMGPQNIYEQQQLQPNCELLPAARCFVQVVLYRQFCHVHSVISLVYDLPQRRLFHTLHSIIGTSIQPMSIRTSIDRSHTPLQSCSYHHSTSS